MPVLSVSVLGCSGGRDGGGGVGAVSLDGQRCEWAMVGFEGVKGHVGGMMHGVQCARACGSVSSANGPSGFVRGELTAREGRQDDPGTDMGEGSMAETE
eukprot:1798171-Rhodomonas_salina.2